MRDYALGRSTRAIHNETLTTGSQAALLIDFDNVTLGIRSDLQTQLRRLLDSEIIKGKVAVQRAYADWRRYPQYIVPLSEASIDLIFAPAFGSNKKNATDIRLAIDALELVFTRPEIRTFILLSGEPPPDALPDRNWMGNTPLVADGSSRLWYQDRIGAQWGPVYLTDRSGAYMKRW